MKRWKQIKAVLKQVSAPQKDCAGTPVGLSAETIAERKQKSAGRDESARLDQLIVYGDVEHGGNFEYLVGYFTRFEEALLVLNANGKGDAGLGQRKPEQSSPRPGSKPRPCMSRCSRCRNQPHRQDKPLKTLLQEAGIAEGQRTGLVGWKAVYQSAGGQPAELRYPFLCRRGGQGDRRRSAVKQ